MNKDFKKLDEQLDLLKSRGIQFDNESNAKQVLLSKNYFDVINGFESLLLEEPNSNTKSYPPGTNFNHFLDLYYFDKILSTSIFRSIEDFEIKFKTSIAYRFAEFVFSNNSKENPDFYQSISFYDNPYSINNLYHYINNLGASDKNPGGPYEIKLNEIEKNVSNFNVKITKLNNSLIHFNRTNSTVDVHSKKGKTKVNYYIKKINSLIQKINAEISLLNNNIQQSNVNSTININSASLINLVITTQINQIQTQSQSTRERINVEINNFIDKIEDIYRKSEHLFSKIATNNNKDTLSRYPHEELEKFIEHKLFMKSSINKQKLLYDYIKVYDNPPIWVFIKSLTLGETSLLFHGLKKEIVENVLDDLGLDNTDFEGSKNILLNSISILTDLRNNCAHFGLIQHFKTKSSLLIHSALISKLDLHPLNGQYELKLYDTLLVLNQFTELKDVSILFQKYFENKPFLIKKSLKKLLKQMGNENMVDWISF